MFTGEHIAQISKGVKHKVTVASAAIAPVHMVHTTTTAINDETVAHIPISINAAVQNRAACGQLGLHHSGPFFGRVVITGQQGCTGIVTEQLHALQLIVTVSATGRGTISHVTGLSAITHEHSHRIPLLGRSAGRVLVEHIVPIQHATRQSTH